MVNMAIAQNKLVAKAEKEYEYLTGDEAERRWQELREKAERDEISAYTTGKSDGKIETAKAMLKDNISKEIIEKYTGLNKEELEELLLEKV